LLERRIDEHRATRHREREPIGLGKHPHVVTRVGPVTEVRREADDIALERHVVLALQPRRFADGAGEMHSELRSDRAAGHERAASGTAKPSDRAGFREWIDRLEGRRREVELQRALPFRRGQAGNQGHRRSGAVRVGRHPCRGDVNRLQRVEIGIQHRVARPVGIRDVDIANLERCLRPRRP
jgi:hypothetical protein